MSDLSATHCGCNNTREGNNGCCSLRLILLVAICGGNHDGWGCGGSGFGHFNNNSDGCGCGSWIWLLILLCCCGGNSFC